MIKKFNNHIFIYIFFLLLSITVLIFFFGSNLYPKSIDWITKLRYQSEHFWHYNGWSYFYHDSWRFPLGLNPKYGNDIGASIVFTDSIPLIAFIFKSLKSILPENLQYYTIWILICIYLQLYFSFKIIFRYTHNLNFSVLGAVFFILLPGVYLRMMNHVALTSHFLILGGIYLTLFNHTKETFKWSMLICVSSLVQFYFTLMLLPLYFAKMTKELLLTKNIKIFIHRNAIILTSLFITMYLSGYFSINLTDSPGGGYGNYGLNLLSPFNPYGLVFFNEVNFSNFLPKLFTTRTNSEDFNYLGLGGILIISFGFFIFLKKSKKNFIINNYHIIFISLFFIIISLSQNIYFGEKLLLSIKLPDLIYGLLGFFRSSGRFFWVPMYIFFFFSIFQVYKYSKYRLLILFSIILVQFLDISSGLKRFATNDYINTSSQNYKLNNESLLKDLSLGDLPETFKHLKSTYIKNDYGSQIDLMTFSLKNNFISNDIFTLARFNKKIIYKKRQENIEKILNRNVDSNTIYFVYNEGHFQQLLKTFKNDIKIKFFEFNKHRFMLKTSYKLNKLNNKKIIKNYEFPILDFNKIIKTKNMNNKYLGFGWTYNLYGQREVITEGHDSFILYSLKNTKKHKIVLDGHVFKNINQYLLIDIYINDIFYQAVSVKDKSQIEIIIDDKYFIDDKNFLINLKIKNPISHLKSYSSPDARELGFYLDSIYLSQ